MVELPPAVDELNEFGRFAFLNEMHTMASQIMVYVKGDEKLSEQVKLAIDAIEGERKHLRESFTDGYSRPDSKTVVALIMRCAELYLQTGIWYDMSRAQIRLAGKVDPDSELLVDLKECFASPDLTERYVISSPIIELTLTRIEMIKFFEAEQYETYKGPEPGEHDPLSQYTMPYDQSDDEVQRFNNSTIQEQYHDLDNFVCDDNEYLEARENSVWAILRSLRTAGSVATIIYYLIFFTISIYDATVTYVPISASVGACIGTALFNLLFELVSLRSCMPACCKPQKEIEILYPGLDNYIVQYIGNWAATIFMAITIWIDWDIIKIEMIVIICHHCVALIWPIITQCLFFKYNQRVERKFKWIRVSFFDSCWWTFYKVISCILFTPSVSGIHTILYSLLKNKPSVTKMKEPRLLVAP